MNHLQLTWRAEECGIEALPQSVVDSHGKPMDVSGNVWRFNTTTLAANYDFDLHKIQNPWLLYSLKRHLLFTIRRISPSASFNTIRVNTMYMAKAKSWSELASTVNFERHETLLVKVISETLELLRSQKIAHNFRRLRGWYSWGADFIPELGFDSEEAYKWEITRLGSPARGVAVRTSDPTGGPLNDAELIMLRRSLMADQSMDPVHVQQRTAIWPALIFGRNPANIVLLRNGDFSRLDEQLENMWILRIPRIKKGELPRTSFKEEYVEASLAQIIQTLLERGPGSPISDTNERPLFSRQAPRAYMVGTPMEPWAWHLFSSDFTNLIQDAVERYGIISPRTSKLLHLTTRRLRYTFATNRVREGISARELADALDHTDLQHVRVYFDARSTVVERLDRAAAMAIAPMLKLFKGRTVKDAESASQGNDPAKRIRIIPELIDPNHQVRDLGACGKTEFCNLFPPYSCYPCDKFEAFQDSLDVHEMVFDFLVERRERLRSDPLESSRIAVQLDEVIYACGQVILETRANQNGVAQ